MPDPEAFNAFFDQRQVFVEVQNTEAVVLPESDQREANVADSLTSLQMLNLMRLELS